MHRFSRMTMHARSAGRYLADGAEMWRDSVCVACSTLDSDCESESQSVEGDLTLG